MLAARKDPVSREDLGAALWMANRSWRQKMLWLYRQGDYSMSTMYMCDDTIHSMLRATGDRNGTNGIKLLTFGAIKGLSGRPNVKQEAITLSYDKLASVLFAYGGPVRSLGSMHVYVLTCTPSTLCFFQKLLLLLKMLSRSSVAAVLQDAVLRGGTAVQQAVLEGLGWTLTDSNLNEQDSCLVRSKAREKLTAIVRAYFIPSP
jgi:hypothetical protein